VSLGARNVSERAGPASTNVRHAVERGRPQLARMFAHTSRSFFRFGRPSPKRLAKSVSPPQPDFTSALDGIYRHPIPVFGYFGSRGSGRETDPIREGHEFWHGADGQFDSRCYLALHGGPDQGAPAICLPTVRRGAACLHRRELRDDRGDCHLMDHRRLVDN
jgi:hypothetical protein